MIERYTEPARRTLFFARHESSEIGGPAIEPEHLLLGLLRENSLETSRMFDAARVTLDQIREEIQSRRGRRSVQPLSQDVPFSSAAKRALAYAEEEADRLLHDQIGTEHVLLGLLREEQGLAASILNAHGLQLSAVREDIVRARSAAAHPPSFPFPRLRPPGIRTPSSQLQILARHRRPGDVHPGPSGLARISVDGFTLRELVAWAHGVDARQVDLPLDIDSEQYDLRYEMPAGESWPAIGRVLQEGIERHFALTVSHETRPTELFILTALEAPSPGRRKQEELGGGGMSLGYTGFTTIASGATIPPDITTAWRDSVHSIGPISMMRTMLAEFAEWLEEFVGAPVIDETGLTGRYDIELHGEMRGIEELRATLRQQLALELTPSQREMERLIVRRT